MAMKKFLSLIMLASGVSLLAQDVVVRGTVEGIDDGVRVYLMSSDSRSAVSIASDTIRNGAFCLQAPVDEGLGNGELGFAGVEMPSITGREFFIAPGAEIEITVNGVARLRTWPVKSTIPEQAQYDRFIEKSRKQHDEMVALCAGDPDFMSIKAPRDSLSRIIDGNDIALLKEMSVNDVWLMKLTDLAYSSTFCKDEPYVYIDDIKTLFERIPSERRDETVVERIHTYLYPPETLGIGDFCGDDTLYDLEGNTHSLKELNGKWTLVDFWSRGCYPCILALPELRKFSSLYGDDIALVSISSDSENAWRSASASHNITWRNWSDKRMDAGVFAKYGCSAIPCFIVISPEGKITDKWEGFGQGVIFRKMLPLLYRKGDPVYSRSGSTVTVDNPAIDRDGTYGSLSVAKIEIREDGVVLHFDAYSSPDQWIMVAPEAWIETADGSRYKAVTTEVITLSENYYVGETGRGSFSITFEPIDGDAEKIDFHESENKNDFHIIGLRLKE